MKAKDNTDEPTENYNILLFIPDGRLYGQSDYNFYQKSHSTEGDLQPYMFINTIKLNSTVLTEGMTDSEATVKQDWTSSLRTVITQNESETFRLTREIDGVETDVPLSDFNFEAYFQDGTVEAYTDGSLVLRKNAANTLVNIKEARYAYEHDVTYRVYGRILCEDGKNFEWVISNEVTVTIPGFEPKTNPDLNIALVHESSFNKSTQKNDYTNTVNFLVRGAANVNKALRKTHIAEDTQFVLRRFKISAGDVFTDFSYEYAGDKVKTLATITVEELGETTEGYAYAKLHLTDNQGLNNNGYFTLVTTDTDGKTEYTLAGKTAAGDVWGTYVDKDTYDVRAGGKADDCNYVYRLFGVNVKNFHDEVNNEDVESGQLRSNRAAKRMPRIDHGYDFTDYSLEEIKADGAGTKALSVSEPTHTVTPRVTGTAAMSCDLVTVSGDKLMADVKFDASQSYWHLYSYNLNESLLAEDAKVGQNVVLAAKANAAASENQVVMIIKDGENTYGTPRIQAPRLPKVIIGAIGIEHENNAHQMNFDLSVTHDNDDEYLSHGFGVWGYDVLSDKVFIPDYNSTINQLRHHKHAEDDANVTFAYTNDANGSQTYEDKSLNTVYAHVQDVRSGAAGTAAKPYSTWYRVRYYAKRANTAVATAADADANEDRYVIVESVAGANYQNGTTTGVEDVAVEPEGEISAVYSLQGIRVNNPEAGQVYIVVRGNKATRQIWR